MPFTWMTGNEGKTKLPLQLLGREMEEKVKMYKMCPFIMEENLSSRTVHFFAKAVHSEQAQRGED